jgi:hypothetical protein
VLISTSFTQLLKACLSVCLSVRPSVCLSVWCVLWWNNSHISCSPCCCCCCHHWMVQVAPVAVVTCTVRPE